MLKEEEDSTLLTVTENVELTSQKVTEDVNFLRTTGLVLRGVAKSSLFHKKKSVITRHFCRFEEVPQSLMQQ